MQLGKIQITCQLIVGHSSDQLYCQLLVERDRTVMQKLNGHTLYSASDLVNFLDCAHLTTLDRINLDTPLPKTASDDQAKLIQKKGVAHETASAGMLRAKHKSFVDISQSGVEPEGRPAKTLEAMRSGTEIIYQAALRDGVFIGHADFLRKVNLPSSFGDYSYEVLDTKLSRSPKGKYVVQLAFYSNLLARVQRVTPTGMYVVLGDSSETHYRVADYAYYFDRLRERFLARVEGGQGATTYPVSCERCELCHWRELCEKRRHDDDYLGEVANITRVQIRKLEAAGIKTLRALAELPTNQSVAKIGRPVLSRIQNQARLQYQGRVTGKRIYELIGPDADTEPPPGPRGFARLPEPTEGDLFFDMEGDPLEENGVRSKKLDRGF